MTISTEKINKKWSLRLTAIAALVVAAIVATFLVSSSWASAANGGSDRVTGRASGVFTGPDSGAGTFTAQNIGQGDVVFSNLLTDPAGAFPVGDFVCLPVIGGDQTFTVANGDVLNMVYVSGDICVDSAGMPNFGAFETHVTGGTGKFRGARGVIFIDADSTISTFPNWISSFERESWIKLRRGSR